MPLPLASSRPPRRSLVARLVTFFVAVLALLALSAGVATAGSELESLAQADFANDGMGSTGIEWSGATYNADTHSLLTVDDEHNAYEFLLNADGTIDDSATPRLIDLAFGSDDFEGVAWISGQTYGFLSEADGEVFIATIPAANGDGETTIRANDILSSFPVIWGSWGNLGPEGLATDGQAFYVARELPATLTKFDLAGNLQGSVDLNQLADASGVVALGDGTFLVVSHESRKVAHYAIDWDFEEATLLATRDADLFTQLEGIAVMGGTDVYLFGENNDRKGQHGRTYSHLTGTLVPPTYSVSDVDCSGTLDLGDALIVLRIDVGIMQADQACGSGDHNGDGVVDLTDALLIARCQVGISNMGCPDASDVN